MCYSLRLFYLQVGCICFAVKMKFVIIKKGRLSSEEDYQSNMQVGLSNKPCRFGTMWYSSPRYRIAFEEGVSDYFILEKEKLILGIKDFKPLQHEASKILAEACLKISEVTGQPHSPAAVGDTVYLKISNDVKNLNNRFSGATKVIPRNHLLFIGLDVYGFFAKDGKVYIEMELVEFKAVNASILAQLDYDLPAVNKTKQNDNDDETEWS